MLFPLLSTINLPLSIIFPIILALMPFSSRVLTNAFPLSQLIKRLPEEINLNGSIFSSFAIFLVI